ncbi:pyrroloquinoline quinone precursor peptide PqqA, partial [Arthrospira platensis SPKY1]|nr:pyrroloquinoline quinone precursor peptide PqqA [Arthrospira platensis SPKY1]
ASAGSRSCRWPNPDSADPAARLAGDDGHEPVAAPVRPPSFQRRPIMQWTDPAYCDIRLGFEVTAYVYVR